MNWGNSYFFKVREVRKKEKKLPRVTVIVPELKIFFSCHTQGSGKCENVTGTFMHFCVFLFTSGSLQKLFDQWERRVCCYHCQKSGWWHSFEFRRTEANIIILENVCMISVNPSKCPMQKSLTSRKYVKVDNKREDSTSQYSQVSINLRQHRGEFQPS